MSLILLWEKSILLGNTPHAVLICGAQSADRLDAARRGAALYCTGQANTNMLFENPRYLELNCPCPVKELRQTLNTFCMRGSTDGTKAMVLAEAHLLNPAAQNALLKTVEEPPNDTLFILTGNEPAFLSTILSRCMVLRLGASPIATVEAALLADGMSALDAKLYARLSDGVLSLARDMQAEETAAFRRDSIGILKKNLFAASPFYEAEALLRVKEQKSKAKGSSAASKAESDLAQVEDEQKGKTKLSAPLLESMLNTWLSILRDALVLPCGGAIKNIDCAELINKTVSHFTIKQIQGMIGVIVAALRMLSFQASVGMVLDWTLANMRALLK